MTRLDRSRRPAILRSIALSMVAIAAGCQLLIDGKLTDVRCQDEGAIGPPACPVGEQCKDGRCGKAELGAACATDDDCARGDLCLDPAMYRASGEPRCSRACCTSADCDPDERHVCWVAPNGVGNFCRAAVDVGRDTAGTGRPLAKCDTGTDCRSGVCRDHQCADTCCSDTSCASEGGACRFASGGAEGRDGFWCAAAVTRKLRYEPCATHDDCASGLCVLIGGALRCSTTCCDSASCEVSPDKATPVACVPMRVDGVSIRACSALVFGAATGDVGNECTADGDCRSGRCVELHGVARCTDACCTDASCGDPSSFVCRPAGNHASWALRCEPK